MGIEHGQAILGDFANLGYDIKENYQEGMVSVIFKDQELETFDQETATKRMLQSACKRHMDRLAESVGATQ